MEEFRRFCSVKFWWIWWSVLWAQYKGARSRGERGQRCSVSAERRVESVTESEQIVPDRQTAMLNKPSDSDSLICNVQGRDSSKPTDAFRLEFG